MISLSTAAVHLLSSAFVCVCEREPVRHYYRYSTTYRYIYLYRVVLIHKTRIIHYKRRTILFFFLFGRRRYDRLDQYARKMPSISTLLVVVGFVPPPTVGHRKQIRPQEKRETDLIVLMGLSNIFRSPARVRCTAVWMAHRAS